jgi:hypothetical protein
MPVYQKPNYIVGDPVIARLPNPKSDATWKQIAAVGDCAIGDFISGRLALVIVANRCFADPRPTRSEVREPAMRDSIVLATASQFDPVGSKMRELTTLKCARVDSRPGKGRRHSDRRLTEAALRGVRPLAIEKPLRVRERQIAKR